MKPSAPSVPVVIIAGYLGAGKTTFINRLLAETTDRLVVIVNDFGSVNIDAALIRSQHDDTIELTNGCVCCAISGSLADVMLDISDREVQPDAVFIECSGVADPSAVAAYAHLSGFHLAAIVSFIDADNWLDTSVDRLVADVFWRQVDSADVLVLSKLDLVSEEQTDRLRQVILDRRPSTALIDSTNVSPRFLFGFKSTISEHNFAPVESPHFHSQIVQFETALSQSDLESFLEALPENVVRVKGIVAVQTGHVLVQRIGRRTVISPTTLPSTGLVIISAD